MSGIKTGWWNGGVYLDNKGDVTKEEYDRFCDPEMITFRMFTGIMKNGDELGEAVGVSNLKDSVANHIKCSIFQKIDCDSESYDCPAWELKINCTLEGEDIDFDDLSDDSKTHIINHIFDGCRSGEICEVGND